MNPWFFSLLSYHAQKNSMIKVFKKKYVPKSDICMKDQLRMMLLMGIKRSLTTYPMPPMMANPKAHDWAIFLNSTVNQQIPATSGFSQTSKNLYDSLPNFFTASTALSIYLFILYYRLKFLFI
jgi:hypothetical protein